MGLKSFFGFLVEKKQTEVFSKRPKGELISKCHFSVFKSTEIPTKIFKDFCPSL